MPFGFNAKLYRNTGTYAVPVWNEIPIVGDCSINDAREKVSTHTRLTGPVATYEPGVVDISITAKIRVIYDDEDYEAVREAYINGSTLDIMCLDGPLSVVGVTGYRFLARVFTWSQEQNLGSILYRDIELAPTSSNAAEKPRAVKITAPDTPTWIDFA